LLTESGDRVGDAAGRNDRNTDCLPDIGWKTITGGPGLAVEFDGDGDIAGRKARQIDIALRRQINA